MRLSAFLLLTRKEFADAARSRWLAAFVLGFGLMGIGLVLIGSWGDSLSGRLGFGRTTAALLNLVLLLVPLMALVSGSLSVAGERERGTLAFLLSLPFEPAEVFWAKFAGLGAALASALGLAFGTLGLFLAFGGGMRDAATYGYFFAITLMLAAVCLALGLLVSVRAQKSSQAAGVAVLVWLMLVFGGDLGLMGAAVAMRIAPMALLALAWLNPLSLYRLSAIDAAASGLDVLGPAGRCAQDVLGAWLRPAALAGLSAWLAAVLAVAYTGYCKSPLGARR